MTQSQTPYTPVNAAPVKSFFVSMLTRDIKLEEAILDLLDNCVDGIVRSGLAFSDASRPYEGYWAKVTFDRGTFEISDNCGGIPWHLSEYAFRMGRDPGLAPVATGMVGVYGIGMKRAIFKMGKSCEISTRSGSDEYEVSITSEWVDNEDDWEIPVQPKDTKMSEDGTTIVVGDLYEGIVARFDEAEDGGHFKSELHDLISTHFAFILDKGFRVIDRKSVV